MGEVGSKFILLARKVPTLVATFPHKTSITTGSGLETCREAAGQGKLSRASKLKIIHTG
jgi:hypothetical protein